MLAVTKKTDTDIYITKFVELNPETVNEAEQIFLTYKQENTILNDSFHDNTWFITNEAKTATLSFSFSETLFKAQKNEPYNREMGSYQVFVDAVKVYFIHALGYTSLEGLQQLLASLKKAIQRTGYFSPVLSESLYNTPEFSSNFYLMLIEFTDFILFDDIDEFQEICEDLYSKSNEEVRTAKHGQPRQQRQLAEFQSFFYLGKLLNQFWQFEATDDDKLFYYPVYLWWKITGVLPLRPTEFIVTPSNCLRPNEEGEYFLTIRRTHLKGKGNTKKTKGMVSHKVDLDYDLYEYPVSFDIAQDIIDYQERVKVFGKTKFLFSKKAYSALHGKYKGVSEKNGYSEVLTLVNIRNILSNFYNLLQKKFGLTLYYKPHHRLSTDKIIVKNDDEFLKPKEIMLIHLGDTRHFAMVNLVLNDFNPILIKDFAGHEDVNESYHYFSHIDKIVKCMSYYKSQELKKGTIDSGLLSLNEPINLTAIAREIANIEETFMEVDYGSCYSKKFAVGDISDCSEVFGDCFICDHFTRNDENYGDVIELRRNELEKRLREEGLLLLNLLTTYNECYDDFADFQRRILQIQQATNEYMKLI
jgi:hypothetical protein